MSLPSATLHLCASFLAPACLPYTASCTCECLSHLLMQISAIVNAALAKFTAAGAVLVPFDSTPFNQASTLAAQPSGYEQGDVFSRWVSLSGLSTAVGGGEEGRWLLRV